MFPAEILRTASFRLALGSSAILAGALLVQFALITWGTAAFETRRVDRLLRLEVAALAAEQRPTAAFYVRAHFDRSLRSIPVAALFDRAGHRLDGDIDRYPEDLPLDGVAHRITVRLDDGRSLPIRAAAATLPDGTRLLIGRDMRQLADLRRIVLQALAASFAPALLLSLAGGAILGYRALVRVGDMHRAIERIVGGGLHERLPVAGTDDDLDRLAGSVNSMLERIERLVAEARGIGDDVAHDLRTPIARIRATLERARDRDAATAQHAIERAIAELDRAATVVTALLRIAEIEAVRRRAGFADTSLREIAADAIELYEPIADAKNLSLTLDAPDDATVHADRDLLMEAAANLLDNAVKFTPEGGRITVAVRANRLCVTDDGIGLTDLERASVLRRFYRADRSRHVPGSGLGLSLVAAIAGLHDASVEIESRRPGCCFALVFGKPGHRSQSEGDSKALPLARSRGSAPGLQSSF